MKNLLETQPLDTLSDVSVSDFVSFDMPTLSDLPDLPDLSGVASAVADGAATAGRRTTRLARRVGRVGVKGGVAGARVVGSTARTTGRVARRGASGSVRVARNHPRASAGILLALIAAIATAMVLRQRKASDESSEAHLAAVA